MNAEPRKIPHAVFFRPARIIKYLLLSVSSRSLLWTSLPSFINWPGNVRELDHAIEHAVTLSNNEMIQPNDLPAPIAQPQTLINAIKKADREYHKGSLAEVEKACIFKVLQDTRWNQKKIFR